MDLGDSSERNERNGGNKIRKTQRQPKDTYATNWTYGDLYTNDAKLVFRRCQYNFRTSIDL